MTTVIERLVSAPEQSHLFMSRRENLRLVRIPVYPQFGIGGQKVGEQPGQTVEFRAGVLRVPKEGEVELVDGRTAPAEEIYAWLSAHRLRGDREEGFWQVDPTAPPVSQEEMQLLVDAALELNVDVLEDARAQELAGWKRPQLLEQLERTLERVRPLAAARDELEAQEAAKAKGGK